MAEFSLYNAGVWVKAFAGSYLEEALTDASTWIDISDAVKGRVSFNPTRDFNQLEPERPRRRGVLVTGDAGGSFSLQFLRTDGADAASKFFDEVEASASGKFQIVVNQVKATSGRPVATATNPQYASTIGMSGQEPYTQQGRQTAIQNISGTLDRDYGVYRA